jgi:hypothetical protein
MVLVCEGEGTDEVHRRSSLVVLRCSSLSGILQRDWIEVVYGQFHTELLKHQAATTATLPGGWICCFWAIFSAAGRRLQIILQEGFFIDVVSQWRTTKAGAHAL